MEKFLERLYMLLGYWEHQPGLSIHERLRGLVFSLLVEIDGEGNTPGYEMRELGTDVDIACNKECALHEAWCKFYD